MPLAARVDGAALGYAWSRLRATGLLVIGQRLRAEAVLDAMLARWPQDAHALASRAHLRALRGARDAAIDDARTLVAAHPARHAADWFNLAFLLADAARLADAEHAFRRAIALDPKLDRAWYGLGLVLVRQRRLEEAADVFEHNTALQPMSPYGWVQLARVQMDRREPDKARHAITRLEGFEPRVAAQLAREMSLAGTTASLEAP